MFGSLGQLWQNRNYKSRSITAENPTGAKGQGGKASSDLGPSRKGSPCLKNVEPGETKVLADITGPGVIQHIWMTVTDQTEQDVFVLRDLVLRMYWDDSSVPSVEVPLGDFFCNGFGRGCEVNSLPIIVNPTRGFNSYFPMPFRSRALITLENQHSASIPAFFYQIDYCIPNSLPDDLTYFHAQWRRENTTTLGQDYVILDGIEGSGHYVGTYYALSTLERYWWGEGEVKFFIDDDDEYPTICGTGTEDYFGGAWSSGYQVDGKTYEKTYNTLYMGYPYYSKHDGIVHSLYFNDDTPPQRGYYRWHIQDAIAFQKNLKVTMQQIGVNHKGLFEREDDVSTVAYWYQDHPQQNWPTLPMKEDRWPR